jgi:methionine synthase I (cobalamin-dependent)
VSAGQRDRDPDGAQSVLRERLRTGTLRLDGAMGTALVARGLRGRAPSWNLSHPSEVLAVHREHVAAGAELVLTNTLVGANADEAAAALRIARASAAQFVAASLYAGLADLERQIEQLDGVECLWLETATSAEMAVDAVRRASGFGLPVVITCAMRVAPLEHLRALGAVAAGYNCFPWPDDASGADVLKLDAAGLRAEAWGRAVPKARLLGGCCETTGAHLAALFR